MSQFEFSFDDLKPLREKNKDEYKPDQEEILEYAEYLGVILPDEAYMLDLVKEGITAQLPNDWQACQTPDGELVYRNLLTKKVQEDHPLDQIYRQKVVSLREEYENYVGEEDPALRTITQQKSEERSLDCGDDIEMPSQQFFQPHKVLKPEQSSDLNRAIIYSSQQFSQAKISSNLKKDENKSGEKQSKEDQKKVDALKEELARIQEQEKLAFQLLEQIRSRNEERMKKVKRKLKKKLKGQ